MPSSGANRLMSELDLTRTQLAVFFITILLAVDSINPVKIFLHVFPSIHPWHVASVCLVLMVYVFISELKALLYFTVKIFFHSILSIFFREVQIVGTDNVPRNGPVIFTVNHANQFVDAVMLLATCEHKISFLMAEASWKRRIIGDIAWALDVVPVKRPQDYSLHGIGKVTMKLEEDEKNDEETTTTKTAVETATNDVVNDGDAGGTTSNTIIRVRGIDTKFTAQVKPGDKIRLPDTAIGMKTTKVVSDVELVLETLDYDSEVVALPETTPASFEILQKVDQKVVYERVLDRLAGGGSVGIFPEGGSHDRTDLLPLKVGVALIAYSALEKDGINIPIVPVGLNYFQRHRFRGRAVVEYGRPIYIDPSTLGEYQKGGVPKREVCNELLSRIQDAMKSVLVTTPDYETLQLIHTARRLYQRKELIASEKQDMNRRFAEGYKKLLQMIDDQPPKEWVDLQKRILSYQQELQELGIRDYQVSGLDREDRETDGDKVLREMRLPYQIAHLLFLLLLAAIPAVFLNLPVGLIARIYAEQRRKKALAKSKVKILARDVMMTEKIVICIALVPSLWVAYGLMAWHFTNLDGNAIAVLLFSLPLFSYTGIVVAEAGMVSLKDVKPFMKRLLPSSRRRLAALPEIRRKLQRDLRTFIREVGPSMGELYFGKEVDWNAIQQQGRRHSQRRIDSEPDLKKEN